MTNRAMTNLAVLMVFPTGLEDEYAIACDMFQVWNTKEAYDANAFLYPLTVFDPYPPGGLDAMWVLLRSGQRQTEEIDVLTDYYIRRGCPHFVFASRGRRHLVAEGPRFLSLMVANLTGAAAA